MSSEAALRVSGKSSISRARTRLGPAPFEALVAARVGPLAEPATRGAWYRGWRLVAFDGSNAERAGRSGEPAEVRGARSVARSCGFPAGNRLTALVEVGTRAAFAWRAGAYDESEEAQAEVLLPRLSAGMLVLADRALLRLPALAAGDRHIRRSDLLWRVKVNLRLPVLERFGDEAPTGACSGAAARTAGAVEANVPSGSSSTRSPPRTRPSTACATTLLDPAAAPATELAALVGHERDCGTTNRVAEVAFAPSDVHDGAESRRRYPARNTSSMASGRSRLQSGTLLPRLGGIVVGINW